MKKADAILVSDLHIREKSPVCRTDNFIKTAERKYQWLSELQQEHKCPILCGGDVFDHWRPSPWLMAWALRNLPDRIIAIPGQHDLPAHNLENIDRSGIQVLSDAGKILLLFADSDYDDHAIAYYAFPWGTPLGRAETCVGELRNVALIHYGVYESKPHYPGAENTGGTAVSVIKKMPGFDLIVSGDNHLSFTCKVGNRLLVNPGSFMRTTAAQADFKPSVYLWYADTNTVERVFVPIEKDVICRDHIDSVEERDERLEAFISRLDNNIEIGISYKENMKAYLSKNNIPKPVVDLIWEVMENEK